MKTSKANLSVQAQALEAKGKTFSATFSEVLKAKQPDVYRHLVSTYAVSTRGHK